MNTQQTIVAKATKNTRLEKGCKALKKITLALVAFASLCCMFCVTAFAEGTGAIDTTTFITTAGTILKSVICLIGGGVALWGVVNLLEGYGNDNPGAKSQGMKQLMAGLGLIILGIVLVPVLINMMQSAI